MNRLGRSEMKEDKRQISGALHFPENFAKSNDFANFRMLAAFRRLLQ